MARAHRVRHRLNILVQVLAAFAVVAVLAVLLLPRAVGWRLENVLSGSMSPTYPIYTVLAIQPVPSASIHRGDVIFFTVRGKTRPVAHRVIDVRSVGGGLEFVTKGDANNVADLRPVPADDVAGRVVFGVPQLGRLVEVMHTRVGTTAVLLVPVFLLVLPELFRRRPAVAPEVDTGPDLRLPGHQGSGPEGQQDI